MNPMFKTDSYKFSHKDMFVPNTNLVYSHVTPRNNKYLKEMYPDIPDTVIVFGLQYVVRSLKKDWDDNFFAKPWAEIEKEAFSLLSPHLGKPDVSFLDNFKQLHKLGYLPIRIKGIPELTEVPLNVPIATIQNTHPDFFWLTNDLEPVILGQIYTPLTVATIGRLLAKLRDKYFDMSCEDNDPFRDFALHDFSFRGHPSWESALQASIAFSLYTKGTDTVVGLKGMVDYYDAKETCYSLSATEHSLTSQGILHYGELGIKLLYESDSSIIREDIIAKYVGMYPEFTGDHILSLYSLVQQLDTKELNEHESRLLTGELINLYRLLVIKYPMGMLAYVSDTFNYYALVNKILPVLKDIIISRDGKCVLRPDCYSSDTQTLTPSGWKFFKDLSTNDLVAQVLDDGSYDFIKPLKIVNSYYKGKMFHFKDFHGKVDQLVTPDHRMIYKQINPTTKEPVEIIKFAKDMKNQGNGFNYFERSAKAIDRGIKLTDFERLNIAFQADGSYTTKSNSRIRFSFSKQRKIERLANLLDSLNLTYKIYVSSDKRTTFNIHVDSSLMFKDFNWVDTQALCSNWCEEFLEELKYWDSSIRNEGRFKYDTTTQSCSSVVELIALSAGKGVFTSRTVDDRKEHFLDIYTSNILDSNKAGGQSWTKEEVDYDDTVHCVQVPTGRLLVKRNQSIMVCGNSGDPEIIVLGHDKTVNQLVSALPVNSFYRINDHTYIKSETGSHELVANEKIIDIGYEQKGTIKALEEIFGTTVNSKGYKELPPQIGIVYGDGINYERMGSIYKRLTERGYAVNCICMAAGAYMLSGSITRDSLSLVVKASQTRIGDKLQPVYKDPITDQGKTSPSGFLKVTEIPGKIMCIPNVSEEQETTGMLRTILLDGKFSNQHTYDELREEIKALI